MAAYAGTKFASKTDICTGPLAEDNNNDCRVNLADRAIISTNWLNSTILDQSQEPVD